MQPVEIAGQLNPAERQIVIAAVSNAPTKPKVVLEVGIWLGGGSTLHILRALEKNNEGHLWGIEADRSIYDRMIENLRVAAPEALHRFTPIFGFSQDVIPEWLKTQSPSAQVDLVFLDGGDNPMEQITEFQLLDENIPVGGQLLAHDAKLRKGKWLVPYLGALDHWETELHDVSDEGLFRAKKIALKPSGDSQRGATQLLKKLRRSPTELIGRWLPAPVCRLLLAILPTRLRQRIGQGR